MKYPNILKTFLLFSFLICNSILIADINSSGNQKLSFRTKKGQTIIVEKGIISFNNKIIYKYDEDAIIYNSKYNRLIEDNSTIFLFITINGSPNKDRLEGFKIQSGKAIKLVDAIASPISDLDNDGYLEFGGADLTEAYDNKDSMYYIPTAYYEIKKGAVHFDSSLTIKKDIELNGMYLKNQLDKNGNCCKVIRKPKKK
jgi:hypothetical protein